MAAYYAASHKMSYLTYLSLTPEKRADLRIQEWIEYGDTKQWLDLASFHLTAIPRLPDNVEKVSICSNPIKEIEVGTLSNCKNLKEIFITQTELTEIPESIFHGLFRLEYVSLCGNRLRSLPKNIFRDQINLRHVNISHNHFRELEPELFYGLPAIKQITLGNRELCSIPKNLFQGLTSLRIITIQFTNIIEIPPTLFKGLFNLAYVFFAENTFTRLPEGLFDNLPSLRDIECIETNLLAIKRHDESVQEYLQRLYALQDAADEPLIRWRTQMRCITIAEELAAAAMRPERVSKWLDMNYDVESW